MALTDFQRRILRLIAENRIAAGESDVAGAAALNELIGGPRISRDIDLFHDTDEAVTASWDADRQLLERQGLRVQVLRERPSYVEAEVKAAGESVRMEWARDSAYRFFPLVRHDELGLVLHPFDLATNKVLALVGRLEVRDWIDVIYCANELPVDRTGTCVLTPVGQLFTGNAADLKRALTNGNLLFHAGRLRGAFPRLVS